MRRFVFFVVLCCLSLPFGLSVTGCSHDYGQNFCSGFQSGPQVNATASIDLEPRTYGVSLNYGQIGQVVTPRALNCHGDPSGLSTFTYGTSNLELADISPTGELCGGTWNRNTGNGIPDYTTCVPPPASSSIVQQGGGTAYITASGGGATSNPVPVFVHPPVTSIVLGTSAGGQQGCVSQNQTTQLNAKVYSNGLDITSEAGHLTYTPQDNSIVVIQQNGVATAHLPGSTVITATVAQAASTAGYFFTCPPKSIQLTVGTTNNTSVTVNPNNIQPLTANITDTLGNKITGLQLTYTSTNPININVSNTGSVRATFPSDAAIVAQCLPPECNGAPQDQIANLSTGVPVTSNPVQVITPGPSSTVLYMSNPNSYNFVPVDFLTGTVGTPIRLPYQPNSMVMDESGQNLFFGSTHEVMIVSTLAGGGTLTTADPSVPGTVLAVAPDDAIVAIHDPCRQLFYLYTAAGPKSTGAPNGTPASTIAFAAPGPPVPCDVNNQPLDPSVEVNPPYAAAFTQDSQTLYIVGENVLYVYSTFTGWHVCTDNGNDPTANCPIQSVSAAVTVPGVGVFTGGQQTRAFGYCPLGPNNAGQNPGPPPTGLDPNKALNPTNYYPPAETLPVAIDELASTFDGKHIIGASAANGNLTDIDVSIPAGACPLKTPLQFTSTFNQTSLNTPNVGRIDQVLTSPNSKLAFVTFQPAAATGSNNTLPAYTIPAQGIGTLVNVPLTGQAGAPIAGTFSPDTNTFYVSTSGDDLVHFINTTTLTDTKQINPALTDPNGNPVPALFLAARPRPIQ